MISIKDVEHVAKLARLVLTEEEKQKYAEQLARIIEHFQQLQSVNTDGIEPLNHALPITNVLREDQVVTPPGSKEMLNGCPEQEKGFFKVPKIGD